MDDINVLISVTVLLSKSSIDPEHKIMDYQNKDHPCLLAKMFGRSAFQDYSINDLYFGNVQVTAISFRQSFFRHEFLRLSYSSTVSAEAMRYIIGLNRDYNLTYLQLFPTILHEKTSGSQFNYNSIKVLPNTNPK
jgi:hypothetical protein